jgi:hypothetical protein
VVTKRSGRAETALISRRRATVEQTRCRRPPAKDQGKNKPSTNRTLRHTDSDSRIRRVESFASRGACKHHHQIVGLLAPRMPQMETGGPSVGQTVKESANCANRRAPPFEGKPQSPPPCGVRKHYHQIVGLLGLRHASNRDSRTIRRTNGEGIGDCPNRRAARFKGKPQSPLSRGPIRSWLTRRSRRRSPSGPERGSCEQIGAARLWPSVAVPTRTSAMEAETASSKTRPGP